MKKVVFTVHNADIPCYVDRNNILYVSGNPLCELAENETAFYIKEHIVNLNKNTNHYQSKVIIDDGRHN